MTQFADAVQKIRQLPRRKRILLTVVPLMFVGILDMIKAYSRGDIMELVAVAIIFFVIVPICAVGWDRYRHS